MAPSAVLNDMLGDTAPRSAVELSESIGPMQSAAVDTLLPIIGVEPFDETGELFSQFEGLVPSWIRSTSTSPPVDRGRHRGNRWPTGIDELVASVSGRYRLFSGGELTLAPLPSDSEGRILVGFETAPASSFEVEVSSPHFGQIALTAASQAGRVTVVAVTIRTDGRLGISQNLLRIPAPS